jgi:hypothetical protein
MWCPISSNYLTSQTTMGLAKTQHKDKEDGTRWPAAENHPCHLGDWHSDIWVVFQLEDGGKEGSSTQ